MEFLLRIGIDGKDASQALALTRFCVEPRFSFSIFKRFLSSGNLVVFGQFDMIGVRYFFKVNFVY